LKESLIYKKAMERPFLEGADDSTWGFPEKFLLSLVFPFSSLWPVSTTTDIRVNRLVRVEAK
jgi:hypothetical protein